MLFAEFIAIECADSTRVILHDINGDIESPFELLDESMCGSSPSGLFYDDDVPSPCKPPILYEVDFVYLYYSSMHFPLENS